MPLVIALVVIVAAVTAIYSRRGGKTATSVPAAIIEEVEKAIGETLHRAIRLHFDGTSTPKSRVLNANPEFGCQRHRFGKGLLP